MQPSSTPRSTGAVAAMFTLVALQACSGPVTEPERFGQLSQPLGAPLPEAFCTAVVDGVGSVDTEEDYLPNVVNCENGGAGLEALKVQAIAARSVLYYAMGTNGSICDGTGCQVYSCGKTPGALHRQAVEETSGVYLAYNGNVTYAAYRAGDPDTSPPSCVGGASETSAITYNEGNSGTDVEQTTSLFVHDPGDPGYGTNRGCMSQNGSACLEDNLGYDYREILQFYFGEDIGMIQAPGPCIVPLPGEGGGGSGAEGGSGEGAGPTGGSSTGGAPVGGASYGGDGAFGASVPIGGQYVDPLRGVPSEDDESCSCRLPGHATRGPHALLLVGSVALGAWAGRRRRRRLSR